MVLAPQFTARLATRFSGRALLTAGLALTVIGNALFWLLAGLNLPYSVFVVSMLVSGMGAGILNGETVKVLGGAVPLERAGMASGLASTTRFIGILVGVAGLGAVLSDVARGAFTGAARMAGLDGATADAAAKRVTSGDLDGMLGIVPEALREGLRSAGLQAFAQGFATAGLVAAAVAALACALAFKFVSGTETAPVKAEPKRPCMTVDCRHPI